MRSRTGPTQRAAGRWTAACAMLAAAVALPLAVQAEDLAIEFEEYRLENGLQVILQEDHRVPLVSTSVWYHVGAFDEPAGRTGFAHLFEHMMFQGSAHVADDQHIAMLQAIGGTGVNGTTNFDRTNYIETVPANHLETALWLESDRMGYLLATLTQEKLDTQIEVVKNERRQRVETAPYGIAEEKAWQALFPLPHPYYGQVIGSMADLEAASLDDVRAFFATWYAPSNATLVLAGDFDKARAKALVEKYFGPIAARPKPTPPAIEPARLTKQVTIEHTEIVGTVPKLFISWHSPPFYAGGDAELDVLSSALTGDRSSRLERVLVHEKEMATDVSAYQYSLGAQSVFGIEVAGRPGVDPRRLLAEVDRELAAIRKDGVSAAEVRRAVNRYQTAFVSGLQQLGGFSGRAEILQRYNHYLGDADRIAWDFARYEQVTPQGVQDAVIQWLKPDARVVLFAEPSATKAAEGE